jgi:hypothetical protein
MESKELILMVGGGIGSMIVGFLTKKFSALPNGLIPLINGTVFTVLFATLGGTPWSQSLLLGMSAAFAGTAVYEAKKAISKPKG